MMGTLLIDQSETSLPSTNQRPVMTTNHRPSTELTTRIVVSQYRTFLVNTSNLKGGKQKVKGGAHPNQLCKSSWYVETYETYEIDPPWPEIGRHDPKLARHDPKLARHDPKSVRHDSNIHQLLNLTRLIWYDWTFGGKFASLRASLFEAKWVRFLIDNILYFVIPAS